MLCFYVGSGSGEIQLLQPSMAASDWARLKAVAVKLLNQRGNWPAAEFLEQQPFEIYQGTNGFGDEFELLYMKAPMDRYLELADLHVDPQGKFIGRLIANAMTQVTRSVRFVAVELDTARGARACYLACARGDFGCGGTRAQRCGALVGVSGRDKRRGQAPYCFSRLPAGAARCPGNRLSAARWRH